MSWPFTVAEHTTFAIVPLCQMPWQCWKCFYGLFIWLSDCNSSKVFGRHYCKLIVGRLWMWRKSEGSGLLWCDTAWYSAVRQAVLTFHSLYHRSQVGRSRCRHYNPARWWEPIIHQHSITSQRLEPSAIPLWEPQIHGGRHTLCLT